MSTISVPSAYVPLLQQMSQATGIPYNVLAAQADIESDFNANAVSPAGAEGWLQFLPSTYDSYTQQAGVAAGTEFNPPDEADVYDVFMSSLLKEFGGNVTDALAAYNAGPNDIQAGMGYAEEVESLAGSGQITVGTGSGSGANTASSDTATLSFPGGAADPLNWPSIVGNKAEETAVGAVSSLGEAFLQAIGVKSVKDLLIRIGLILIGAVIVIVGIAEFIRSGVAPAQSYVQQVKAPLPGE
jgi:hypothetical protein